MALTKVKEGVRTLGTGEVATANVADNGVTLDKMAGLVRGKIIYGDASGDPAALTVGTNGQALVSDGTDISWGSAGASSLDGLSDALVENQSVWLGSDPSSTTNQAWYSVGVGTTALDSATTGDNNVAVGYNALTAQTTGYNNIAVGSKALAANISGYGNVAIGVECLEDFTGIDNTAVGYGAMKEAATAEYNVAIGNLAMKSNTTCDNNTAVGYQAMEALDATSHTNGNNVAVGAHALEACTTGINHTMIGTDAGKNGTTFTGNTLIGKHNGQNITGNNNAGVGYNGSDGATGSTNCGCWGYSAANSAADASNEVTLGNPSISNLRCNDTSISGLSDQRDKTQIEDLPDAAGLDFINSIQPRTFYWDRREWYENGVPDGSKVKTNYKRWKENSGQRMGFIAQEVQPAIAGLKYMEDSGVVNGNAEKLEFAPSHLITPLVKAVQQLSAEVESLKAQLAGQ
jgi:hypothetical protein